MNLPPCLDALKWCDDVVIVDAGSTDSSREIAEAAGARVFVKDFATEDAQLNWIAKNVDYHHPWVYFCDADEIVTEELKDELLQIAATPDLDLVAYRLRYKNYFMNRWIRHCGIYPVWLLRFFRPEFVSWERTINTTVSVQGKEGRLNSHFLHFSFRKGIASWFEKHNRYSTFEAIESRRSLSTTTVNWKNIFQLRNHAARRTALKELSFRMPFRPLLRFFYMYIIKLGFLDGIPGFHYCLLLSLYEYMIVLKMKELDQQEKGSA